MACPLVRPPRPPLSLFSESLFAVGSFARWPSLLLVVPRPPWSFVVSIIVSSFAPPPSFGGAALKREGVGCWLRCWWQAPHGRPHGRRHATSSVVTGSSRINPAAAPHRLQVALQLEQRVAALVVRVHQAGVQLQAALRVRCTHACACTGVSAHGAIAGMAATRDAASACTQLRQACPPRRPMQGARTCKRTGD